MASKWFPLATVVFLILLISIASKSIDFVEYDVCKGQACIWDLDTYTMNCNDAQCTEFPSIADNHQVAQNLLFQHNNFTDLKSFRKLVPVFQSGLKTLDLSHNNIFTIPTGTFKGIDHIDVLDLSYNHIQAFENNPLEGTSVAKLVLNGNRLDDVQTSAFHTGSLPNMDLEELEIKDNQLMFIEKDALNLPFLKKLCLAGNVLVLIGNLEHLGQLRELDLHNNQISTLDDGVFQNMISLEKLDLSNNDLVQIPQDALKGLSSLKSLNLNSNKLIGLDNDMLGLPRLQSLSLSKNNFKMIGPHNVKFPSSLRNITIEYSANLRRIDDYAFRGIINLQNVEINSNPDLAAISHNAFEDVASLQRLSLRDNGLIVIDHTLVPWGQVGDIDLSGNHWHCDCHMAWVLVTADLMPERSAERIVCSSPGALAGMAITDVAVNDMTCPHNRSRHAQLEISLLILATAALFVALTLIIVRFRHAFFPCCRGNAVKYSALYNADNRGRQGNVNIRPDMEQRDMIARERHVTKPEDV